MQPQDTPLEINVDGDGGSGTFPEWPAPSNESGKLFEGFGAVHFPIMKRRTVIVRKMYASSAATTNDLAHIDVPVDCTLVGMDWNVASSSRADGDRCQVELSTTSTGQINTNDAQGVLGMFDTGCTWFTTSGLAVAPANKYVGPTAIPLKAGTRLYLHSLQSGTSATLVRLLLHCAIG